VDVLVRTEDARMVQARPRVTYRADLVTAVLGVWFVVGLFLDAWAHNNLSELETFFTPWHGVFYSGFVATSAWIGWCVLQSLLAGRRGLAAVPHGYGLGLFGIPLFALAGVGDMIWHTTLGIETSLDILFSPTHILLAGSMVLIVTCPLRSAWSDPSTGVAPSLRRLLPAVLSLAFATTLVLLFVQYANALVWGPGGVVNALSDEFDGGRGFDGPDPVRLVSSVIVTNVVLMVPLLLLARRWRAPAGTATILFVAAGALAGAVTGFQWPQMLLVPVLSGVIVDLLASWLRPGPTGRRPALLAFAGLASLATWALYLGVASIAVGRLPAVPEYWTGLPVVAAVHGVLLGLLAAPYPSPAQPGSPEVVEPQLL
jgi:hypothetical protein